MNTDIRPASDFFLDVRDRFYPPDGDLLGLRTHWEKLPFRFAPAELSIHTGINGHGKSLFLNQLLLDLAIQGERSLIASFEMPASKTLHRAVRQALGKAEPTETEIEKCLYWMRKKIFIYDKTGIRDWKKLPEIFDEAREECGVTQFLLDSLMKCGINPDDYNAQTAFVDLLQNYVQKHNVHIHLVAHSRKLAGEEEKPGKMDIKGAGGITDLADNVFSIWRNKKKERLYNQYLDIHSLPGGMTIEKLEREYDCVIDCMKHREMGGEGEGQFGLYFHRPSFQFIERLNQEPYIYCEL